MKSACSQPRSCNRIMNPVGGYPVRVPYGQPNTLGGLWGAVWFVEPTDALALLLSFLSLLKK